MDPTKVEPKGKHRDRSRGLCWMFMGQRYWLAGRYVSRDLPEGGREYLHRKVWETHRGPIPDGWHVHHENEDRTDNRLTNLRLKPGPEHLSEHMTPDRRAEAARLVVEHAMPAARAWHGSEEGRAWHTEAGKRSWAGRPWRPVTCEECGGKFKTRNAPSKPDPRWCHLNCKMRAYRRTQKAKG